MNMFVNPAPQIPQKCFLNLKDFLSLLMNENNLGKLPEIFDEATILYMNNLEEFDLEENKEQIALDETLPLTELQHYYVMFKRRSNNKNQNNIILKIPDYRLEKLIVDILLGVGLEFTKIGSNFPHAYYKIEF